MTDEPGSLNRKERKMEDKAGAKERNSRERKKKREDKTKVGRSMGDALTRKRSNSLSIGNWFRKGRDIEKSDLFKRSTKIWRSSEMQEESWNVMIRKIKEMRQI